MINCEAGAAQKPFGIALIHMRLAFVTAWGASMSSVAGVGRPKTVVCPYIVTLSGKRAYFVFPENDQNS